MIGNFHLGDVIKMIDLNNFNQSLFHGLVQGHSFPAWLIRTGAQKITFAHQRRKRLIICLKLHDFSHDDLHFHFFLAIPLCLTHYTKGGRTDRVLPKNKIGKK